jgi:hypothetical protein
VTAVNHAALTSSSRLPLRRAQRIEKHTTGAQQKRLHVRINANVTKFCGLFLRHFLQISDGYISRTAEQVFAFSIEDKVTASASAFA